ncbi:MAG: hypothetical protein M1832_004037 [Thelocarpon impressellum]|nr:MAG: hypothetical protein M1832_004037 [Thelocarpon impressellum]
MDLEHSRPDGQGTTPEASPSPPSLPPGSYTAHRLRHATPQHLHITSRRCFIGPIPEGWLRSHRKDWYRHHLHMNYSSRQTSFHASHNTSQLRQLTGLDGPSSAAVYGPSFPQPTDVDEDEDDEDDEDDEVVEGVEDGEVEGPATTETPPAIDIPRARDINHGTAPGSGDDGSADVTRGRHPRSQTDFSFRTAYESPPALDQVNLDVPSEAEERPKKSIMNGGPSSAAERAARESTSLTGHSTMTAGTSNSRSSLLEHGRVEGLDGSSTARGISFAHSATGGPQTRPSGDGRSRVGLDASIRKALRAPTVDPMSPGLVRFNVSEPATRKQRRPTNLEMADVDGNRVIQKMRRKTRKNGEMVKMEKMLVQVQSTRQDIPDDYDENAGLKIETRVTEKWREYVVVCRESARADVDFVLQLYKTRVIPARQGIKAKTHSAHEIPLNRRSTKVNLYSSLDKTVVVSIPTGDGSPGSTIYIMRPRSAASSVEWYTFLRTTMGWRLPQELQVHVPDMSLTLQLDEPFKKLEEQREALYAASGENGGALSKTMELEQAVASDIISRCLTMLTANADWAEVLKVWLREEKIGLAWKRYDRLEWIHGANEQRMYGTIAMQKTHELELRPKKHYATSVKERPDPAEQADEVEDQDLEEPAPVEGFLIRLTSQRGRHQRFGRMFYKRLYFYTHDQFLCFCRPARALPPPPPKMPMHRGKDGTDPKVPRAEQISGKMPLIYELSPYDVRDGTISWLRPGRSTQAEVERRDADAYDEAQRKVNTLLRAEGLIDLCRIARVRSVRRGATPADATVEQADQVDFDQDVADTGRDDGAVGGFDDARTFELVLRNGLVVRLETYDRRTKREWMRRLDELARYWRRRRAADVETFKAVRRANLEILRVDEDAEAHLGQFGQKWEVALSVASPQLYNMCGVSVCRAVTISGVLYRKPRRLSTFKRYDVVLGHGQLLLFNDALRTRTGKAVPSSHVDRHSAIELGECYVYSGLVTEGDLLSQSQTFDSNNPGRHALPRVYLEDGWTSSDEDIMTCFVIWQNTRKSLFRTSAGKEGGRRQRLKQVSSLGAQGRSTVFKTRSRAERDQWVLRIGMEIERLQQAAAEEYRIVGG